MKKVKDPTCMLGRKQKHASKIKGLALFAIFAIAMLFVGSMFNDAVAGVIAGVASVGSIKALAAIPFIPFTLKAGETEEQLAERNLVGKILHDAKQVMGEELELTKGQVLKLQEDLKAALAKSDGATPEQVLEITRLAGELKALKETPAPSKSDITLAKAISKAIIDNKEKFAELKSRKIGNLSIEIKAQQDPTDVGQRTDYAEFLPGTNFKPVRSTFIRDLFRTIATGREYVKYREEDTVTRDAKVVIACATSTHNTKKTWVNRTVQIQKVRDMVDICIDMIEDYDFVQAEVKQLVEQSLRLKTDSEMFNGTGDILSIDSIASEFDAANVLAPFDGASGLGFQSSTLAELTAAMKAQIVTFGAENKWMPDTIVMNHNDWTRFMHLKNADGDYLLPNFVLTNGGILNGMRVITNPLVDSNTLYVFDSTQGAILDRKSVTVEFSYENATNFENEVVTVKAYERVQFLVKNIDQDAFMKCSDITAALSAITNP